MAEMFIFALPKLNSQCESNGDSLQERVDSVAQLVEHDTFNVGVLGSSPSGITGKP